MDTFLIKALQLILALLILVSIHEFGHYIFARIFGIKVNRFYLFFNPWFSLLKYHPDKGLIELIAWTSNDGKGKDAEVSRALWRFKVGKKRTGGTDGKSSWRDTMYGIGWLPLGGYCDIAGMIDETKSASDLESEPQSWEFRSKAPWKRLLVMVGGVMFNFILAIIIYAGIAYCWGDRVVPFQDAYEGMDYAEQMHNAGFRDGDVLLSVNDVPVDAKDMKQIWNIIQPGSKIKVLRNHRDTETIIIPQGMLDSLMALRTPCMTYRFPVYVEKLSAGMPAEKAGLLPGDRIVKVADDTTPSITEFYKALDRHKGKNVPVEVLRDGKPVVYSLTLTENGKIGIQMSPAEKVYPVEEVHYGFFASIPRGIELGVDRLTTYVSSLKLLFSKEGARQVGGFGTIGSMFPDRWDWYSFWQITAFLSVILAFMNIIPIPGLDGGHVLFVLWEMVTRRKPSDKFLEYANTIGMLFLILLLIYANGNDIIRYLFN